MLANKRMIEKGISKSKIDNVKKELGLSITLNILLKLILNEDKKIEPSLIDTADEIRGIRNKLVHDTNDIELDSKKVEKLLFDAEKFCEILVGKLDK